MNNPSRSTFNAAVMLLTVLTIAPQDIRAQTPTQMEYDRQQREYRQQQEQQQRQQQLMNENARRQQEESRRWNAPMGPSQSFGNQDGAPAAGTQGRGVDQSGAQALSAARAMWEKRPPLPVDRNPLLGRWTRPASTRPNPSNPFGAVQALAQGGLCEMLFGGGVFEFRPDRLVGMDQRTPEQELDRVEYRGDGKRVVVLPKTTLKLIEFDFEGPDRINWASQKCVLVRAGAASSGSASAATPATAAGATAAPSAPAGSAAGGILAFSAGAPSPGNNVAGRKLQVLKQDPQVALIKGGLKSTPYASVLQNWLRACANRVPDCEKGARALQAYTVGIVTTDANGRAQTPILPAGRYWVLSDAMVGNKRLMWHELVDLKGGNKSLTLDERNAIPVD